MMLFNQHKVSQGSIDEAIQMVKTYFSHRGLNPDEYKLQGADESGWWIQEGSAEVYIIVQSGNEELGTVLRISSPLIYVPENSRERLYRHLLELNNNLSSCALSIYNDLVLVVSQRPTLGLCQEEMDELVWNAAYVADLLDNQLANQFGAKLYSAGAYQQTLAQKNLA